MKAHRSEGIFRPFAELGRLVRGRKLPLAPGENRPPAPALQPLSPRQEDELFAAAMLGVRPLSTNLHWRFPKGRHAGGSPCNRYADEEETEIALSRLIEQGAGFRVSDTPEYMEAGGPGVARETIRRLHQGRFAVQDHVDLHGLTIAESEHLLHDFFRSAITTGKRMVLVIHGRGLTSPHKPVLKQKVYEWLTRGPFRGHVIAFASARACDGGAGATYVLLRTRPLTKKQRKMQAGQRDERNGRRTSGTGGNAGGRE